MSRSYLFEFSTESDFSEALRRFGAEPGTEIETYTAYDLNASEPVDEIDSLKISAGIAALAGLFTAVFGQWYINVIDAPLNIGGRPLNSWPAFIPVAFVLTVLFTGLATFVGFLFRTNLPHPHHPIFDAKAYDLSRNPYLVVVRGEDSLVTLGLSLGPTSWEELP